MTNDKVFSWCFLVILHHINMFYYVDLDALKSCYWHSNITVVNDCDKTFKLKVGCSGQIKSLITLKLFIKTSWNFANSAHLTSDTRLTGEYNPFKSSIFLLVFTVKSDQNKSCVKCICTVSVCLCSQSLLIAKNSGLVLLTYRCWQLNLVFNENFISFTNMFI